MTVKEFAGKRRVNEAPVSFTVSVFGETFVGCSSVFSSRGLAEVSTIALPFPDSALAPLRSTRALTGAEAALTIFRMMSPDLPSRAALAQRLLTLARVSDTS
jgi:hypothetical protein